MTMYLVWPPGDVNIINTTGLFAVNATIPPGDYASICVKLPNAPIDCQTRQVNQSGRLIMKCHTSLSYLVKPQLFCVCQIHYPYEILNTIIHVQSGILSEILTFPKHFYNWHWFEFTPSHIGTATGSSTPSKSYIC